LCFCFCFIADYIRYRKWGCADGTGREPAAVYSCVDSHLNNTTILLLLLVKKEEEEKKKT
jgi:hypothetical protein